MSRHSSFDEHHVLHELKHYLPSQAPLKDFIHHNTLHAFQCQKFHKGIQQASAIFGYKVYLSVGEFRNLYNSGKISPRVLENTIARSKGNAAIEEWKEKLLHGQYTELLTNKIDALRSQWKEHYKINLDKEVHPILFRLVGSYLDQGISIWKFPVSDKGFLASIRELEQNSFTSLFKGARAKYLLHHTQCKLKNLLDILIGDEKLYEHYLFDQQFAHPGWSGMVAVVEDQPQSLLDSRKITLHDFIALELLFEIDALDKKLGENWLPLAKKITEPVPPIFIEEAYNELNEVYVLWQEAYEWSYFDQVLKGLQQVGGSESVKTQPSFQALFCIDDRACSIRRYIERFDPNCETYGTAGFFNAEFYFQPEHGKFYTKVCPAPLTPQYLIQETNATMRHEKDAHFSKHSKGLFMAWFISQTMGFWSAIKLAQSIFKPTATSAMVSSFKHMDKSSTLTIEATTPAHKHDNLQIGFTVDEMANRIEAMLKSIGLIDNFAPLVYIVGHGASSVNNTHYAGYDCGACSGRAGSANARVAAYMGNHPKVREILKERGIEIPDNTQFLGGLHDTTRDEMEFYGTEDLSAENKKLHQAQLEVFNKALDFNAKERSRRFLFTDSSRDAEKVHDKVKLRALSLFEPRPEWNHATNSLCIVGRRENNKHLFLDRRSFLNSYDYEVDPDGKYLLGILKAVAPVCGGINLEYYFSRIDNYRLGAGSKLPHNVMGLIGVANGMDGDLRPGLPKQMINIHDPLRLMTIVEHYPDVVLKTIQEHEPTYEWFLNEWVHLAVIHPIDKTLHYFKDGAFTPYQPIANNIENVGNLDKVFETDIENLPVYILS